MGANGRVRVERGIYRQPNGKYAVCCRRSGRLRFRTVGFDLAEARDQRVALIAAVERGSVPVSPRLRFDTAAGWWLDRFEAKVTAVERHPRRLEAHRYQLDRHLLPAFAGRRIACITVNDVADLLLTLRWSGCSPKTSATDAETSAGAGSRRDRAPARRLGAVRAPDDRDHALHRVAHLGDARADVG